MGLNWEDKCGNQIVLRGAHEGVQHQILNILRIGSPLIRMLHQLVDFDSSWLES